MITKMDGTPMVELEGACLRQLILGELEAEMRSAFRGTLQASGPEDRITVLLGNALIILAALREQFLGQDN